MVAGQMSPGVPCRVFLSGDGEFAFLPNEPCRNKVYP